MIKLTHRQNEIYQYLIDHRKTFEHSPTIEEVCTAMGVKSRGSMHKHIQALINVNLIEPFNGQRRGIRLVENNSAEKNEMISLPLVGKIAAGTPIEAIEAPELFQIPSQLYNGKQSYVLMVEGDSMIDIGIFDGDWVVIEQTDHAKNGDVVVALIDGIDATLKRLELSSELVILHPENTNMRAKKYKPERVSIQGKLTAQMRKYF